MLLKILYKLFPTWNILKYDNSYLIRRSIPNRNTATFLSSHTEMINSIKRIVQLGGYKFCFTIVYIINKVCINNNEY